MTTRCSQLVCVDLSQDQCGREAADQSPEGDHFISVSVRAAEPGVSRSRDCGEEEVKTSLLLLLLLSANYTSWMRLM